MLPGCVLLTFTLLVASLLIIDGRQALRHSLSGADPKGNAMTGEALQSKLGGYPAALPAVGGPCPKYKSGRVTFYPRGAPANQARLWVGPNPGGGALVFYFHGTGMSPDDAVRSLGRAVIEDIIDKGGVVIAPQGRSRYAWLIASGDTGQRNLRLIDEMVACSIRQARIDPRRIHATGFSSGATLTSDLVRRRSNYLASAAPKSGGFDPYNPVPKSADPDNRMAVMILHGGREDTWGEPPYEFYEPQSVKMADIVKGEGGFVIMCNHGRGHREIKDARDAVWRFFQDHPFNVTPKPYAGSGLPSVFPPYCSIW